VRIGEKSPSGFGALCTKHESKTNFSPRRLSGFVITEEAGFKASQND
jgi:hypothetical protein